MFPNKNRKKARLFIFVNFCVFPKMNNVVNIIPKRGDGPFKAVLSADAGSFSTFHEHLSFSEGFESADYYVSVSRTDSDGIGDNDDFEATYVSANIGYVPGDISEFRIISRYSKSTVGIDDYDGFTYSVVNDPNSTQEREIFFITGVWELTVSDWWESNVHITLCDENQKFIDSDNPGDLFLNNAEFKSDIFSLDWQNDFSLNDQDLLTIGLEYDRLHGENVGVFNETVREVALYASNQWNITENINNVTGIRFDDNELFGNKWTGRSTVAYIFPSCNIQFYGSIATGFKAPSLNDLYFPGYGDKTLDPESSTGFEAGIKKSLFENKLEFVLTGFYNDFNGLIGVQPTSDPLYPFGVKAGNIDSAESKGIEVLARYRICDWMSAALSYTYDKTEDKATGSELLRRPENKISFTASAQPFDKLLIGARILYVGERLDVGDQSIEDYVTIDLSIRYTLRENIEIYVRGENIFNEEYQETLGYDAPGAAVYGGISTKW